MDQYDRAGDLGAQSGALGEETAGTMAATPGGAGREPDGGRGAVAALVLLAVAAAGAFALIGWDATRSPEPGGPGGAGTVRSPAVVGDPAGAGKPSGTVSAGPGAPVGGSGGATPGRGDSAADREARQRDHVRRSLNSPHPRPPMENPISQDDLDREREKGEAGVSPVPAINEPPPPGGIGTPQG